MLGRILSLVAALVLASASASAHVPARSIAQQGALASPAKTAPPEFLPATQSATREKSPASVCRVGENWRPPLNLASRFCVDAWGNATQQSGDLPPIGYTGYYADAESSHYYAQQRYYAPNVGRFNRIDPWSGDQLNPITLNKYLYAIGNPLIYVDPDGRCPLGLSPSECYTMTAEMLGVDPYTAEGRQEVDGFNVRTGKAQLAALSAMVGGGMLVNGVRAVAAEVAKRGVIGAILGNTEASIVIGGELATAGALIATGAELPQNAPVAAGRRAITQSARALDAELDAMQPMLRAADEVPAPQMIVNTEQSAVRVIEGRMAQARVVPLEGSTVANAEAMVRAAPTRGGNRRLPQSDLPWVKYQSHVTGRDYEEMWLNNQRQIGVDATRAGYTVEAKWTGRNEAAFASSPYNPSHRFYDESKLVSQASGLLELNREMGGRGVRYAASNEAAREHFESVFAREFPEAIESGYLRVMHVPGDGM